MTDLMDEAGARTMATTVGALYRSLHEQMRGQVRGMDHATLNWKPLPLANSVAVLIVHTLAAERDALRAVRLLTTERDREAEFKAEADEADLLALLDQTDREVSELVGAMTVADLTEMRLRGDRPPKPGLEWLLSNYGHSREHLAQIELTKQLYDSRT
jgi:heme exporter protein D